MPSRACRPLREAALPGYEASRGGAFSRRRARRATSSTRSTRDVVKVLQIPDTKERLAKEGLNAGGNTPEQFAKMLQDEMVKMAKIVKAANMKVD